MTSLYDERFTFIVSHPLSAPCSVLMHHHLQEDTSPRPTADHSIQTVHIHYSPEQH